MRELQYPIRVLSKANLEGQATVANITINAQIAGEFEARWIDIFIRTFHSHRDDIGTKSLKQNIKDYLINLKASCVRVDLEYPFFIEKTTPLSKAKSLAKYICKYSAEAISKDISSPFIFFLYSQYDPWSYITQ